MWGKRTARYQQSSKYIQSVEDREKNTWYSQHPKRKEEKRNHNTHTNLMKTHDSTSEMYRRINLIVFYFREQECCCFCWCCCCCCGDMHRFGTLYRTPKHHQINWSEHTRTQRFPHFIASINFHAVRNRQHKGGLLPHYTHTHRAMKRQLKTWVQSDSDIDKFSHIWNVKF